MPSRRAKSKRRQKSKLRQNQHLEQKPVLKNKTEDKKETEEQQDSKAVLLEHYARTVQQRSLVEVALLCLLFNNEIMASSWKLGDLSKSLLGFLMGSQNESKEPSPPIKNSYSSTSKTTVKEQTAKANLVHDLVNFHIDRSTKGLPNSKH